MRGFRVITALLALLLSSIFLAGCWDRTEINDLAIVLATGVDYEEGQAQLTAQIFIPRKGGGGSESGGAGEGASGVTMTRTAKGENIAEALNRLQRKVARHMFWGQCEVIVISEAAGKHGLREFVDFFLRYPQFREHAFVFSSQDSARDILALLDPLERSTSESLREMANMNLGTRVTMLELSQSLQGASGSAVLTRIVIAPPEPNDGPNATTPSLKGLSLYKHGKYTLTVKEPVSLGVLLMIKELNNIIMPVALEGEDGSFSILSKQITTMLTPRIVNGEWMMKIGIQAKGEVVLNTTDANLTDPAKVKALKEAWAKKLKDLAEQALHMSQKEQKTDFFRFADSFRRHYPQEWKKKKEQWETMYPGLQVEVSVKTAITGNGRSTGPQGIPEQSSD
ncbi:Ger(x)C family spore germination protein [Paenibacillus piscarius]|uniref:Ger(x)C family spore germination protein n=1 Tax=Paenibacillus piscarius TaxID=1089681 RepID=UPI001EE90DD5|nr:Ger(x)C family spore germination protein [Paenibacillus piscarius]